MIDLWTLTWVGVVTICGLQCVRSWWCRAARLDIILRSGDWGNVYVLQDVLSPKMFKVGKTKRSTSVRAVEVSRDMAGGRDLRCRHAIHMPFASAIEVEAHRLLSRYNEYSERGTEWFRVGDPAIVARAVNQAAITVRRVAKRRRRWSREADRECGSTMEAGWAAPAFMVRSPGRRVVQ